MTILDRYPQILFTSSKSLDGNMSLTKGDPKEALENRNRWLKKLGISLEQIIILNLELGNKVIRVGKDDLGKDYLKDSKFNTDAAITKDKGIYLFILIGDCIPLDFYDPIKEVVALVHTGWQGLDSGIIKNTVSKMAQHFKTKPRDLIVQFGPSIGPCCYNKFTSDIKQKNDPKWQEFISKDKNGLFSIDIWGMAEKQLIDLGIKKGHIDNPKICTYHSGQYFSHRKFSLKNLNNDYRFATVLGIKD